MNIGICDDNEIYLDMLYHMVRQMFLSSLDIKLHKLAPTDLMTDIKNNNLSYEILITDIDMGELNGIELAEHINKINPFCIIIFLSNYIHYATKVYDVNHIYFVLKTEANVRLPKAIDKAMSIYHKQKSSYLTISYQNVNYLIPHGDISYIESLGRYLYIHTNKEVYKSIKTLKTVADELSSVFVRCHKSFIVNLDYVFSVTRSNCILKTKENIPISTTYSKSFLSSYRKYASNRLD